MRFFIAHAGERNIKEHFYISEPRMVTNARSAFYGILIGV